MDLVTLSSNFFTFPAICHTPGIEQSDIAGGVAVNQSSDNYTMASFYGRASYDYLSKYYLSASIRYDGSSKFTEGNYWASFPAVSAKWRISQESFWKNIEHTIPEAAIRLSYGTAGNNRITSFLGATQIKTAIGSGDGTNVVSGNQGYTFLVGDGSQDTQAAGAYVSVLGNPYLKWETSKTLNAGLDLSFIDNRVSLTVEAYNKKTYNLLYKAPIPTSTGYDVLFQNIGSIQNKGLEVTLNTVNIERKSFEWKSSFNIAFNSTKVLSLVNGLTQEGVAINWSTSYANLPAYILKVGQPLGTLYGLKWVGNYQYSDFTQNAAGQYMLNDNVPTNQTSRSTSSTAAPQPGDIKFEDINGDGVITSDDYVPIGRGFPIHTGGFSNDFSYKNFDLNVFFQWSYGNQILNANRMIFEQNTSGRNQFASVLNRWTPDNQNNVMFRAGTGSPNGGTYYSSRVVEDGSYLRLKTVQLGYSLPNALMKKWQIKQIRFYLSCQNLVTWTRYTGFDPEVSTYYSTLTPGFDWGAYPRARTLTVGANISF
ncbi:MAG: SusC/RagA family TonB-linked outer membrane protein [Niabella sp.]